MSASVVRTEDGKKHLQWCKDRALKILNTGNLTSAFNSMVSESR